MLKTIGKVAGITLVSFCVLNGSPTMVKAQEGSSVDFPDVKENHWAYAALHDLASKGLVKGYPDGKFLGDRALTRYEFATAISRLMATVADMKNGTAPTTGVTQEDLNKIQVLVDKFQPQLDDIKADVASSKKDIEALRQDIQDLRQDVLDTKDLAAKAQSTADNSYGVGNRKFAISGYIQARYFSADSDNQNDSNRFKFPHGVTPSGQAYNGTYASGAAGASFVVRRARLKFTGAVTPNTSYAVQIDVPGNSTSSTTPLSKTPSVNSTGNAVTVKEANILYTTGKGNPNTSPSFLFGLFANPFGCYMPLSSNAIITPERPLAFSENSTFGLWAGQDYDRGVQFTVPKERTKVSVSLVNGTGSTVNDYDRHIDQIYRVTYNGGPKITAGVSYYNGELSSSSASTTSRKKELTGIDAQYKPTKNWLFQGEWIGGKYEQRSYFAAPASGSTSGQYLDFNGNVAAPGNKIEGWYLIGGYTFSPTGSHPLQLAAGYDVFKRSKSGMADSQSTYDDVNWGYGVLYNLDKATRLRVWYEKPNNVSHAPTAVNPQKIGLLTTEVQVKF